MKVVWVSPAGSGAVTARALVTQGHDVVSWGAEIGVPQVVQSALATFCQKADLVVVDGPFALERTARSFRPSDAALFFDELRRKYHVVALGPTPTVDLLWGDRRYLRKWCRRLQIPFADGAAGEPWSSGAWFRERDVVPQGPYLQAWQPLFKSVGFRGWFEMHGHDGQVANVTAAWPADQLPEGREYEFLRRMSSE